MKRDTEDYTKKNIQMQKAQYSTMNATNTTTMLAPNLSPNHETALLITQTRAETELHEQHN